MSLDRAFRLTGLVGVALFLATAFTPLAHGLSLWMAVEPQIVPSDAIVVLGAAVSPSGILSAESTRRTDHGIELYQLGLAPRLILLGGTREGGPSEAEIRARVAVAVVLVVALRGVTGTFVSVYVIRRHGVAGPRPAPGLVFQWWREVSGKKAGVLALEERGELG